MSPLGQNLAPLESPPAAALRRDARSAYRGIGLTTKALLSVAALGAGTLLASAVNATVTPPVFDAPGIPKDAFPDFSNSNNVYLAFTAVPHSSDYVLAAAGTSGVFNLTSTRQYSIDNEAFAMYAEFNNKGQFISGGETIFGCSPPGSTCKLSQIQNLYTVSFDKYAVSTSTVGLGFDTEASTASGWAKQYQTSNESLYLYGTAMASLDNALAAGKNLPNLFTAKVSEFTTVPLPGAVWLLGPALAGLFAGARRRGSGPETLSAA